MGDQSAIEWTDATWNPTVGCSIVSPGCTNCYAMKMAARIVAMGGKAAAKYAGLTMPSKAGPVWNGTVRLDEAALLQPLRWRKGRRIFVNSMSDLFHEDLPDEAIDKVFAVMALAPQHTFQVLTKRAARMREYCRSLGRHNSVDRVSLAMRSLADAGAVSQESSAWYSSGNGGWHFPNIWLGVSAEDQERADERVPELLRTPAAVRFVSAEPLLGPIDFTNLPVPDDAAGKWAGHGKTFNALQRIDEGKLFNADHHLDWIILGGESGAGARPIHPEWALSIHRQCRDADVAFFFKQWGEFAPNPAYGGVFQPEDLGALIHLDGKKPDRFMAIPRWVPLVNGKHIGRFWSLERVGKARAGRELDGVTHDSFPAPP